MNITISRGTIIYITVLLLSFLLFAGIYYFFLQKQLAEYKKDENLKKNYEAALMDLEQTFSQTDPEVLIREWRAQVVPWEETVKQRSAFFNLSNWTEHEVPPKEGVILKFWYEEQAQKMIKQLYEKVGEKMGRYDLFPQDIRKSLGVPTLDEISRQDVTEQVVNRALAKLAFGIKMCEFLLDSKMASIDDIVFWQPINQAPEFEKLLSFYLFGIRCTMNMKDFVNFVEEKLRLSNRYFNINCIRIQYPYIAYNVEPLLQIEMIISQANYNPPKEVGADIRLQYQAQMGAGAPGRKGATATTTTEEPGFFGKAWKWFKRNILVMN
ncbi:MAG TPA: hypothetical protein PLT82_03525 [Candidatus Hydrogenedens sp.]|nr:hypothetical protein [Candidatus Hydrogenedens sp.]HOK08404.1 hypothetical protein [Candidatus Hydrogenedens sp.]HOL20704.1 hypothetical protein [Candidatus Hydrogenedens sp.]HPP58183.1 hypothetical protein [Candidatus Hydrogenedens sp.]